ncbi:dipeptide epimerase [Solimonas sp. K1W22B-7]|uniref:dipeptide epimerase n=1 Tax=Solimonas sp. K1W22B-7 TaxID=2303331 RepID=UPI000E32EB71|nr:dipeptide epimerase [Solimonas sp. K1W22B-7]AXQ30030.1 dipeptide epimerase [Solimonas sp. K1W22B-7]
MTRKLSAHSETWQAVAPFRITGRTYLEFQTLVAEIGDGSFSGRGEGMGIYYMGDTAESMLAQIESVRVEIEAGADRQALRTLLPPGGARNTLDAALWDLESRISGKSVWALAGVEARTVETVYTIGIEAEPEAMGEKAARVTHPLLKIKLDGDRPVERVEAIRRRRPDARLVVDANQGWSFEQLREIAEPMKRLGVLFIEQPLRRGGDAELEGYQSPLPLAADESCLHMGELEQAARRYQMINIKLDKCGGLTEGLGLARAARERGLGLMVGCMGGSSLAVAPAHVLAQLCDYVDIDGPLLLKNDRIGGFSYDSGQVSLPPSGFCWGH